MAQPASAFLVVRRDDGFGDVSPLHDGARYTLGRAPTNRVVLRDDLCSREHAEVFSGEGGWHVAQRLAIMRAYDLSRAT